MNNLLFYLLYHTNYIWLVITGYICEFSICQLPSLFTFYSDLEDQTDPNIDEEMMKAYEDFLQDFEEHLLLQEFGEHPTNEGGMAP